MTASAPSRSFFNDGVSVLVTKMIVIGLSMLAVAIQARALGPTERGVLAMLMIYPQLFTSIAEGGMRQATVYYVGRGTISDARIFGASIAYTLGSCAIFSTLIFFILHRSADYHYSTLMIVVAASMLPVNLLMNAIRGMFLGKQHIGQFNTSQTWQKFLLVLAFAALYLIDKLTAETAVVCMLLTSLIGFIPAQYFFFRNIYTHIEFDFDTLWRMIKKGCIYAGALFLIEATYRLDVLILGWMSTKEEVGLYSIAVNVGELLWQLPAAVGVVVFSRSANDRNSPRWQEELARSIRISLWATVAGSLALCVIAPPMFDIMFGKDFGRSVFMTWSLLPGIITMTIFKLLNMELAGKGKPFITLFIMLPVVALNMILNYLMIPSMGGVGAALASSICYVLAAVIMLVVYCRMYDANFLDFIAFRMDDIKVLTNKISSKFPARREA